MASGGHHGGGFHSGGHHSGGGGFGGGGFGGGFGGGHSHHSSGYIYRGARDDDDFEVYLAVHGIGILICAFIWFFFNIDNIPGFDYITTVIFIAATVIFVIALKQERDITYIGSNMRSKKKIPFYSGNIYYCPTGSRPKNSIGSRNTWASRDDKSFAISFFDRETQDNNIKEVHETVHRYPWIVWWSSKVWVVFAIICLVGSLLFYEAVIPTFENMIMTNEAFAFIDNFIFYLPSSLALLSSIACLVFHNIQNSILHECAMRIAQDNKAAEDRQNTIGAIESAMSRKWYYNECPNCGAVPSSSVKSCPHCGTSLEVQSLKGVDQRMIHRVSTTVYKMNSKAPIKRKRSDYCR